MRQLQRRGGAVQRKRHEGGTHRVSNHVREVLESNVLDRKVLNHLHRKAQIERAPLEVVRLNRSSETLCIDWNPSRGSSKAIHHLHTADDHVVLLLGKIRVEGPVCLGELHEG